jgi:hypothetical protein
MANRSERIQDDVLDELVSQLLDCGGVLSQMITGMVEWQAAGRSAPNAAPIPQVAHALIASVLTSVRRRHSRRDLKVAAAIVDEVTQAVCDEIFCVPLDDAEGSGINGEPHETGE